MKPLTVAEAEQKAAEIINQAKAKEKEARDQAVKEKLEKNAKDREEWRVKLFQKIQLLITKKNELDAIEADILTHFEEGGISYADYLPQELRQLTSLVQATKPPIKTTSPQPPQSLGIIMPPPQNLQPNPPVDPPHNPVEIMLENSNVDVDDADLQNAGENNQSTQPKVLSEDDESGIDHALSSLDPNLNSGTKETRPEN